ncbi:MAG: carboxypeptidase-like regulatory domain-containing protein, partial [Calditrichaeota bacterium]|nr:carboxypeptidase-like regulatory domain-containing protein [Calditrichota bacterium]
MIKKARIFLNRILFTSFLLLFSLSGNAFSRHKGTINGSVADKATGEALPGVNILIAGTVLGTTTDMNGKFSIRRLPPGSYTLKVSMIGYEMAERKNVVVLPDKTTTLHFDLVESVIETQEILVTANKRRQSIQDTP